MLLEGIQNLDIYTANESQPYALKKYMAKRLKGIGIPLYDYIKDNTDYIIVGGSAGNAGEYDSGSKYPNIAVRERNWSDFDAKTEKNKNQNSKQHISKVKIIKDIISDAKNRQRLANEEINRYEKIALKYSHLLLKRFFNNPEKYI